MIEIHDLGKKTPDSAKADVAHYLLSGYSYSEVAKKTGISKGAVSGIVRDLKAGIGKKNTETILVFAKEFRKSEISMEQAFAGARVHSILEKLRFDDDTVYDFLSELLSQCQAKDIPPDKLVQYSLMLFKLSESSDVSLEELVPYYESLMEKKEKYQAEIASLEKDRHNAKARQEKILNQEKVTAQTLKEYKDAKKELGKFGVTINDLPSLAAMLAQTSSLGFDPQTVIDHTKRETDFETRISQLQDEISGLKKTYDQKNKEIGTLHNMIEELQSEITDLSEQKQKLKDQINTTKKITLDSLNQIRNTATSAVSESADAAKSSIKSVSAESENSVKDALYKTKKDLNKTTENFESLLDRVSEASKEIGKMEAIAPLHELIFESKGEPVRVYLSMISLLDGFKSWQADNHVSLGTSNHTTQLHDNIREEIDRICKPR